MLNIEHRWKMYQDKNDPDKGYDILTSRDMLTNREIRHKIDWESYKIVTGGYELCQSTERCNEEKLLEDRKQFYK